MAKKNLKLSDKSGFELALNTVVLMILAVTVLIMFLLFLTMGSTGFMDTIKGYFSYSNVDSVINSCNLMVSSNMQYKYCCEKQKVKYYNSDKKTEGNFTCSQLLNKSFAPNIYELDCVEAGC
jgi:hypothetical protein